MTPKPPSSDELSTHTDNLLAALEHQRGRLLMHASRIRRARARGALREAQLRATDAKAARATVKAHLARESALLSEAERARVPDVEIEAHQAAVHGRVVDAKGLGETGVWVVVLDSHGRKAARVETAEVGYFQFVFPPDKVDKVDKSAKVEAGSAEAMIRLEIRDAKGNVLVRKSDPVKLARGKVVYCEVKVSS
ncbi:MAG TPA: hypothetical protein VFG83_13910, partial [Kofleriaceae bacterium]|nr:hypothetical protein [Kofleriaceae bacterium]